MPFPPFKIDGRQGAQLRYTDKRGKVRRSTGRRTWVFGRVFTDALLTGQAPDGVYEMRVTPGGPWHRLTLTPREAADRMAQSPFGRRRLAQLAKRADYVLKNDAGSEDEMVEQMEEDAARMTPDAVLEAAAEDASYCDDQASAQAALDRGRRMADALSLLPEGWSVYRSARRDVLRERGGGTMWEVTFELRDADGDECGRPRVDSRDGEYIVHGGPQRGHFDADEARGRAAVLILAAIECEHRNA